MCAGSTPSSAQPRLGDGAHLADPQDGVTLGSGTHFDFGPCALEQLQEEEQEADRYCTCMCNPRAATYL